MIPSGFRPYIARNHRMGPYKYDLWITDQVDEARYGSECQDMRETTWCLAHIREGMTIADCGLIMESLLSFFPRQLGLPAELWHEKPCRKMLP